MAPCTLTALEVIATVDIQEIRRGDFELRMHQRGCDSRGVAQALVALERRGWASATASSVTISDAGYLAATKGVGVPAVKKRARPRSRVPPGLL